uniref:Beta-xylanase n=1 Tax=uncultured bacterium contig00091 TaxID=1181562 RepID=A0A806K0E4_9BACT|nr:endo-1,4-beta-xylanase A precursor [uncultured bacterium contig00091]
MKRIYQITFILLMFFALIACSSEESINNDKIPILDLEPMKDQFNGFFLIGNIYSNSDTISGTGTINNQMLTHHFNAITAENLMKPQYMSSAQNSYNWTSADNFVNAANNSDFKVIGHTLLWHSQNAGWMNSMASTSAATARTAMEKYITDVVTHFKGKIYSWDVLNEVFPDSVKASDNWRNVMRQENPWFKAIGSDFVYEGFLAARKADPNAILYYNDYNTDQVGKATMIRNMVREVNEKYLASSDKPSGEAAGRLLIEGIGMQEHHNLGVSASSVRSTVNMFRPLGVKLSVSELDVLAQTWGDYSSNKTVTSGGLSSQATKYYEYFKVYLDNADIIERVSFWGVTDNQSWRARGQPLLFDSSGMTKAAYHAVIQALNQYK